MGYSNIVFVLAMAGVAAWLFGIRRAEEFGPYPCDADDLARMATDSVARKHVGVMLVLVFTGFVLTDCRWYTLFLAAPVGWAMGLAWARRRVRQMGVEVVGPQEHAVGTMPGVRALPEGAVPLKMVSVRVPPLPWWLDPLLLLAGAVLGATEGWALLLAVRAFGG